MLELPKEVYKKEGRWYKLCPTCGKEQSYLRRNYAIHSFIQRKECKSCTNNKPENNCNKGWIKNVLRYSFVKKYKTNAILRGIEWNLSFEYLAEVLIDQEMKCALSGWDIDAMSVSNNTASLDRINSLEGYVVGNVQWVHKMVNMCKQKYDQNDFIKMCESVTKNSCR